MESQVALVKVHPQAIASAVLKALRESINLIGGVGTFCRKGDRILVKPNISSPNGFECANPSVTQAVAKIFSDHGCEVLIGEDPAIPIKENIAYEEYGLYKLAEEVNAKVVSLRYGPHIKVKVPGDGFFSEIEVSSIAQEADLVVGVAAMKTVNITAVTLGLKNMKGLVRPSWKRKFHCEGLSQGIVDLNAVVKPGLSIIDGTFGKDLSASPWTSYAVGLIIASSDIVAADAVCARVMGFDPERIDHIRLAHEEGLGTLGAENIEIRGERLQDWAGKFPFSPPKNPFKLAEKSGGGIKIVQGNPCSVCLNSLGDSLALHEDHLKAFEDVTILVGPEAKPSISSECTILFGKCLKKHKDKGIYVAGCPPHEYESAKTGSLKKVLTGILQKCDQKSGRVLPP